MKSILEQYGYTCTYYPPLFHECTGLHVHTGINMTYSITREQSVLDVLLALEHLQEQPEWRYEYDYEYDA